MSRATVILTDRSTRERVCRWAHSAPSGTRVEFKEVKRSLEQNARMWAMLTEVATQATHMGRRYTTDEWKVLFLHALGKEMTFLPALDGTTFVPYGQHSSDLGKSEMTALIDLIFAWGAEHGVTFHDDRQREAA